MSLYKVGDVVYVKAVIYDSEDTPYFTTDMKRYRDTLVTISKAFLNENQRQRYRIHEDSSFYTWCDEFFEPANLNEPYEFW